MASNSLSSMAPVMSAKQLRAQQKHLKKVLQMVMDYIKTFSCSAILSTVIVPILKNEGVHFTSWIVLAICAGVLIWILVDADYAK